jgi:predicted esterase
MVSTGGSSAGSNAAAGTNPTGGAAGTTSGGGGSGGGGQLGGSGGQSGASTGGASGSGTGGASAVVPSAGCGKAGRPPNGEVSVPNDRIYDFPTTYDGTKPFPAVIGLHGANNPNTILQMLSKGSRLESEFVRVFPKSNGSAWQYNNGTGPDMMRIADIYTELLANYCVDTNRIFLMGHSSGAQMSVHMMCAAGGDKRFKAYAPVAASKYCDMLTPAPVMYIQGMMDAQRGGGDGKDVVDVFVASNKCMAQTMPDTAVPMCNSTFDQKPVNPGCVTYQGCTQPTIWCSHNDNGYNLTDGHMHGWPCFASNAIADFFLGLP